MSAVAVASPPTRTCTTGRCAPLGGCSSSASAAAIGWRCCCATRSSTSRPRSRPCRWGRARCRSTGTGAARRSPTCSSTAARRCSSCTPTCGRRSRRACPKPLPSCSCRPMGTAPRSCPTARCGGPIGWRRTSRGRSCPRPRRPRSSTPPGRPGDRRGWCARRAPTRSARRCGSCSASSSSSRPASAP